MANDRETCSVIMKFDIYGNQLENLDDSKYKNEIENLSNISSRLTTLLTSLDTNIRSKVNEIISQIFTISKSYISFKNKRIVSVLEAKDPNDVIIKKQVTKMIDDAISNKLREKRDIEEHDFVTETVLDEKLSKEIDVIDNTVKRLLQDIMKNAFEILSLKNEFNEQIVKINKRIDDVINNVKINERINDAINNKFREIGIVPIT